MSLDSIYRCLLMTLVINHKRTYSVILGQNSKNPLLGKFSFLYKWILDKTNTFPTKHQYKLKQRIHWILNNLTEFPRCKNPECSKVLDEPTHFKSMEVGYVEHCSCKCINNDPIIRQQIKDTCDERYGVNCSLHSQDAKQKSMNSIREHYGDGVSNVFQSEQVKCLIRERKKEKYDNPTFVNPNKAIKTRRQKHNGRYESIETTENRMKTFQDRYGIGVVNAGQTPQHKNAFQDLDKLHRAKELERQTKLKNGSYAKSKLEDKCYSDLIQKFCHVERQYTSELYPFRCDFYVEKIDSYIEINGYWTHGKHAFDECNYDDLQVVQKWRDKHTSHYDNAIKVWTVRDVLKRTIAHKNNLRFYEFWNYSQFKKWFDTIDNQ